MSKNQLTPQLTPIARVLRTAATVLTGSAMAWPMVVPASPAGGQVVNGQAQITNPAAGNTVINQQSNAAIINWQSFSIGDGEYVVFNQPSVSAATLNRVVGNLPSEILGNLTANGRVFVINANGVMFGANSRVDVGALITSTGNISNEDFLSGNLKFSGNSTASIVNRGQISAANGGFVVLSADKVTNSGTISAPNGDVLLASGSQLSLQLDPEGLISYSVDAAAASATAGVENFGDIIANGGAVVMAANVARGLIGTAINNTGRVSARGIEQRGGEIYLVAEGGSIEQRGVLDASSANGDGGRISIRSDRNIALAGGSRTDASGVDGGEAIAIAGEALFYETGAEMSVAGRGNGEGGFAELSGRTVQIRDTVDLGNGAHLLIDPVDLRVDDAGYGGNIDYSTLFTMLQLGDVTIEAENSIVFSDYQSNFFSTSYGGALIVNAGVVPAGCALSLCDPGVTAPAHAPGIFFDGSDDTFSIYGGIQLTSTVADSQIVSLANLSSGQGGGIAITAPGLIDLKDVSAQYGGDIEIISSGGAISTGNLNLTGNLFLTADADITLAFLSTPSLSLTSVFIDAGGALLGLNGAPINASGTVDIESAAGDLSFASINAGPSARIAANGGTLSVGDVYAYDYSAPASISLAAAGDLVAGDLSVSSYGDDASIVASADGSVGTGNLYVYAGASGGDVTGSASITASADGATTGTTLQTGAISVSFGLSPSTGAGVVSLSNAGGEIVAGQIEVGADETGSNITRTVNISALGDIYGEYVEPEVVLLSVDRKDIDGVNSNGLDIDLGTSTGNATVSVVSAQGSIRTRYLTAGPSTGTTSGITLTATAGSITADDDSFMSGGAIGVSAANIDLSGASLDIGSGYAGFGEDQAFVALDVNDPAGPDVTLGESIPLLASGANPQPNASFKSPNQILLGNLDVEGSYAFVKAPAVTANNVSGGYDEFEAPLPLQVFNFRPYDDGGNLVFPNAIGGDLRNNVLSYLLGGTDYAGTISFPAPLTVVDCTDCVVGGGKDLGNANYVLYTSGSIINQAGTVVTSTGLINPSDENLPSTSGQFIVLKKATPPPVATPTPTPVVTPTPTPAVTPTPTPVATPTPTPAVTPTPTPVATPTPTPVITPTPTPVVTPTPTPVITPTPTPVVTPTPTPVVTPTPTPMADMTEILTALAEAPKTDDQFLKPTPIPKPGQGEIQRRDTSYQIGEFSCDATGVQ